MSEGIGIMVVASKEKLLGYDVKLADVEGQLAFISPKGEPKGFKADGRSPDLTSSI